MSKPIKCDGTEYTVFQTEKKEWKNPRYSVTMSVDDGNLNDYEFRLTPKAARALAAKLIETADLSVVSEVMEA